MPQLKNIVLLVLLFFAAFSCKKKQPAPQTTEPPKTGIHKMEGKRVWKGKFYIDYDPKPPPYYGHYDTSYEITFINTIYVLGDSTISYSPDFSDNTYKDTLFLNFLDTGIRYYFSSIYLPSERGFMSYYYKLDSFFWNKFWITDSNWQYAIYVHSP